MIEQDLGTEATYDAYESEIRMQVAKRVAGILTATPNNAINSIVLFGSTACGQARRTSDIDMAIFLNEELHHYSLCNPLPSA